MHGRRLSFLCAAAVLTSACSEEPGPPPVDNVVLIVADTLRADRLGCYGYPRPTSPTIDALAKRGTLYEKNHSQGNWTVPSMISMISGLYVTQEETELPVTPTLLEVVRAKGLETAAFVANEVLVTARGFERGVDHFEDLHNEDALTVSDAFAKWLGGREKKKRFFAWVHYIDPHHPYEPAKEFDVFDGPRPDFDALKPRWEELQKELAHYESSEPPLDFDSAVALMERENSLYDGEVREVDEGVRRVLAALEASGEMGRTLIVFASDHGEMLFEQPMPPYLIRDAIQKQGYLKGGVKDLCAQGHRPWYYEDLWNTPLILVGPGIPAGARKPELAQNLDLYPTILEALDIASPRHVQGKSIYRRRAEPLSRVHAYGQLTNAVLDDRGRKLVLYPRPWFLLSGEGEAPSVLYDLELDGTETRDLTSNCPVESVELRQAIEKWRVDNARAAQTTTTPEQAEALRALGYGDGK